MNKIVTTLPLWAKKLSLAICYHINLLLLSQNTVSLMLTGGRSSKVLYSVLASYIGNECWQRIHIFFSDERNVDAFSEENNAYVSLNILFPEGIPYESNVHRIKTNFYKPSISASEYSVLLPESIDILLLSMGEDGHIASLFPGASGLNELTNKMISVIGPKPPRSRITISPVVIQSAKQVFVLAIGDKKRRKYEEALIDPDDIKSIPARLVLNKTWIFDLDEEFDLCPKL